MRQGDTENIPIVSTAHTTEQLCNTIDWNWPRILHEEQGKLNRGVFPNPTENTARKFTRNGQTIGYLHGSLVPSLKDWKSLRGWINPTPGIDNSSLWSLRNYRLPRDIAHAHSFHHWARYSEISTFRCTFDICISGLTFYNVSFTTRNPLHIFTINSNEGRFQKQGHPMLCHIDKTIDLASKSTIAMRTFESDVTTWRQMFLRRSCGLILVNTTSKAGAWKTSLGSIKRSMNTFEVIRGYCSLQRPENARGTRHYPGTYS
jgi:hypothetical protein